MQLMVTYQNETEKKLHYSFQFKIDGNEVYVEHKNGIVKVVWDGRVNHEIASSLLTYTADLVEGGLISTILLDRQNLIHFDNEARNWIKNEFLSTRCNELAHLIKKVAIINESSFAAQLYGKKVTNNLEGTFPNLPIMKFDRMEDANKWILKH